MKKIKLLLLTFTFMVLFAVNVFAGTGVIQFGDPTVTRDKTFNLTMKVKSNDVRLKQATITIEYNPSMIEFISGTNAEGGAGTVKISGTGEGKSSGTKTLEYILKFKALYAGIANVNIVDQEVVDNSDKYLNVTKLGTSKITIKAANTQSKNANLASLEFSPGEIDREFDQNVLDYNTEVNADVDMLILNAIPEDKDARVTISGNENLKTGMNKVEISVTAPDGKTQKNYTINVTKLENGITAGSTTITNGQKISSNKFTITIMTKPDDVPIPSGYQALTAELGGGDTQVAYCSANQPAGETPEVFLVYGMDQNGNVDFYRIDQRNSDNTIQRYVSEPNAQNYESVKTQYETLNKNYKEMQRRYNVILPVAIGLLALVFILIIILIVVIVKNGSNHKNTSYQDFNDDDDDDDYFTSKNLRKVEDTRKVNYDDNDKDELDDDFDDKKDNSDNDIEELD